MEPADTSQTGTDKIAMGNGESSTNKNVSDLVLTEEENSDDSTDVKIVPVTKIEIKATKQKNRWGNTKFHDANIVLIYNISDEKAYLKARKSYTTTGSSDDNFTREVLVGSVGDFGCITLEVGKQEYTGPAAVDVEIK